MLNKTYSLTSILLLLTLISCKDRDEYANENYTFSSTSSASISDIFSDVEIIPLSFSGNSYPSVVEHMLVNDNYIIILDDKKILHVFKPNGCYIASSNEKIGNGPGEYSVLMGFTWNPYTQFIEVLTPNRLYSYDEKFNLKNTAKLPTKIGENGLLFCEIFDLSATRHLLLPTNMSDKPYCVMDYDSSRGLIVEKSSYSEDIIAPITMQPRCFFLMRDNTLLFIPPVITNALYTVNGIQSIDNRGISLQKEIALHTEKDLLKEDIQTYEDSQRNLNNYLISSDKNIRLRVFPNSKKIIASYKFKNGCSMKDMFTAIIDRQTKKVITIKLFSNDSYQFPFIEDIDEEYAYAIIEKEILETRPKLLMNHSANIDSVFKTIEDESLVLLKYKIRE